MKCSSKPRLRQRFLQFGLIASLLAEGSFSFAGEDQSRSLALGPDSRALVSVVDLHQMTDKASFYRFTYREEERAAIRMITRQTARAYGAVKVLTGKHATLSDFVQTLDGLEQDPKIQTIDVIIYLHGHSAKDHPTPEICFVLKNGPCLPTHLLPNYLGSFKKLRMLYSDACHGHEHLQDWLKAGFRVASGSEGVDTNFSTDLKRFIRFWTRGNSFQKSIAHANSGLAGNLLDRVFRGNSQKEIAGDAGLRIQDENPN